MPALAPEIALAVQRQLDLRGLSGSARPLFLDRLVRDASRKYVVLDKRTRPIGWVAVSPDDFPDAVSTSVERSLEAARALGEPLGAAVLLPWFHDRCEGNSWSLVPYLPPVASGRLQRRWAAWRLLPSVFSWLAEVGRRTAQPAPGQALAGIDASLERMQRFAPLAGVSRAAGIALVELREGRWQPQLTLSHNDLWSGNLLWSKRAQSPPAFRVIDWGAMTLDGFPVYDAIRLAMSLGLPPRALTHRLQSGLESIGATHGEARYYLTAALARLLDGLGEWPVERFAETARACDAYLEVALGPLPERSGRLTVPSAR